MVKIREAIVVEGKYDKNTLLQIVDATVLETSGFGIFKNREQMALLHTVHGTAAWVRHPCAQYIAACGALTLLCVAHCITVCGVTVLYVIQGHWCVGCVAQLCVL